MRCLLLAAGLGTRLKPLTNEIPKCLVTINNKPLLEYWFELLFASDIERVLVNTHYFADKVESFIKESKWTHKIDFVYEAELLGTAGTVANNIEFFQEQATIIAHADNLTMFDVNKFIQRHVNRPKGVEITMMTFVAENPQECGIIEEDDEGKVINFYEKENTPRGNIANAAVYIFEPSVFSYIKSIKKEHIDISNDIIPNYMGRICTYLNDTYHRDIGTIASLKQANKDYAN